MHTVILERDIVFALRKYRNPTGKQKRKMKRLLLEEASYQEVRDWQDKSRFKTIDNVCVDTYSISALPE